MNSYEITQDDIDRDDDYGWPYNLGYGYHIRKEQNENIGRLYDGNQTINGCKKKGWHHIGHP